MGRRRPGQNTLEKRIGKAEDSRKSPLEYVTKAKPVPLHAKKALGGRWYSSYSFLTSALDGIEWSESRPGRALALGKWPPCTQCTGGWVGPRAGLDTEDRVKKCRLCRGSNVVRPVHSQTIYWLSYPAHNDVTGIHVKQIKLYQYIIFMRG
jgi:hypothetical protein